MPLPPTYVILKTFNQHPVSPVLSGGIRCLLYDLTSQGWACHSVVGYLCDVCKAMGLIPILKRKVEILFSTQEDFDELCSFSKVFMETILTQT